MEETIPEEVLKQASDIAEQFAYERDREVSRVIARGILAERERCAKVADAVFADNGDRAARGFLTDAERARKLAGKEIATSIRSGV